jgi:hypothetical protein
MTGEAVAEMDRAESRRACTRPGSTQIGTAMATNSKLKALVDPPYGGDLQEWIRYRDDLRRMDVPRLAPFIAEADDIIARLRSPDK